MLLRLKDNVVSHLYFLRGLKVAVVMEHFMNLGKYYSRLRLIGEGGGEVIKTGPALNCSGLNHRNKSAEIEVLLIEVLIRKDLHRVRNMRRRRWVSFHFFFLRGFWERQAAIKVAVKARSQRTQTI